MSNTKYAVFTMDVDAFTDTECVSTSSTEVNTDLLDDIFGTNVVGFKAPCFSMDEKRLNVLHELGFSYDSSHLDFPRANHTVELDLSSFRQLHDGIFHKNGFYEFGLSKQKIFGHRYPISGGGYVRLGNRSFIKSLIRQYIRHNNYYVFYLHPFELTQEKIPFIKDLKLHDRYYINYGISSYGNKIEQIIKMLKKCGYKFVTFEELTKIMSEEYVSSR